MRKTAGAAVEEGVDEQIRELYDRIIVVSFGGQYAHLIARRLRDIGCYAEVVPYTRFHPRVLAHPRVKAVVLSGGPSSVLEDGAPGLPEGLLSSHKPVLGICYGHQLLAKSLGGRVERGRGEYGRTIVRIEASNDPLFEGWSQLEEVWMSHGDYVAAPPPGSRVLAVSVETGYIAAFAGRAGDTTIYGVQFHPEVSHTRKGKLMLENFALRIAGCTPSWKPEGLIDSIVAEIRRLIPSEDRVLVAVSGGVDSTTTAVLVRRAVGDRLVAVLVDHGLFREGEVEEVLDLLSKTGIRPLVVDAKKLFLERLRGITEPEEKRRIIGEVFAEVFKRIAESDKRIRWLAQGTTYPDVIESGAEPGADRIKSHHNVAGLPSWLGLRVIEPLRHFYKDEVRRIALSLGVPERIALRHPFPGPGLAVRIIGEVTEEKLAVARRANRIVEEEIWKAGLYDRVWQAFAVIGDDRWVGVKGDKRVYGYIVIVRVVESEDGMTADWARLPYEALDRIAHRITSEIPQVTMVAYAVTTKPPATIEPQ